MLENPECLVDAVRRSGAHSTDLEHEESAEELSTKCVPAAQAWKPVAERLWTDCSDERAARRDAPYIGMAETDIEKFERAGRVMHGAFDPARDERSVVEQRA